MIKAFFFVSGLAGLALQFFYYLQLPDRVATHFNAIGQANSWMQKHNFTEINCAIFLTATLVFAVFPHLMKVMPDSFINTPNREYWLSPRNKNRFIAICTGHFYFFGLMTNGLLIYVFHQVYRFNLGVTNAMAAGIVVSMFFFVAGMLGSVILLMRRLKKAG